MILWFRLQKNFSGKSFLRRSFPSAQLSCSYSSDSCSSWPFQEQCRNKYPLGNLLESFKFVSWTSFLLSFFPSSLLGFPLHVLLLLLLFLLCVLGFYKPDSLKQCCVEVCLFGCLVFLSIIGGRICVTFSNRF